MKPAPINSLEPHPDLLRLFDAPDDAEISRLAGQMADGEPFPALLIDEENHILAGLEHWLAARHLGWDMISVFRTPPMRATEAIALMVAENIRHLEIKELHLSRSMNNFFDMQPLRPPGGW